MNEDRELENIDRAREECDGVEEAIILNLDHIICALEDKIPAYRCTFICTWWESAKEALTDEGYFSNTGKFHGAAMLCDIPEVTDELNFLSDLAYKNEDSFRG